MADTGIRTHLLHPLEIWSLLIPNRVAVPAIVTRLRLRRHVNPGFWGRFA